VWRPRPRLGSACAAAFHGYTNATWLEGDRVHKQYVGEDAGARMRTELDAIRQVADRVPVPLVLDVDGRATPVTFSRAAGRHGQDLIDEGQAASVLKAAGRTLRALQAGQTTPVLVHGDYGPQNLLHDPLTMEVVTVLDWEFAHHGDLTEDWRGPSGSSGHITRQQPRTSRRSSRGMGRSHRGMRGAH
jgi:tRNA A-37 threonylcarbamoyl transferase component Bud32